MPGSTGSSAARARSRAIPHELGEELHEILGTGVMVLAGVHLAAVLASSLAHGENLVRAMVTGRKPQETGR
jgi:cytochrome b